MKNELSGKIYAGGAILFALKKYQLNRCAATHFAFDF